MMTGLAFSSRKPSTLSPPGATSYARRQRQGNFDDDVEIAPMALAPGDPGHRREGSLESMAVGGDLAAGETDQIAEGDIDVDQVEAPDGADCLSHDGPSIPRMDGGAHL